MRPLHPVEADILKLLTFCGVDHAVLAMTAPALMKGFIDATNSVRDLLRRHGVHDFQLQEAGEQSIKYVEVVAMTDAMPKTMTLSLQRPAAKGGRFFRISKLGALKQPLRLALGDLVLISIAQGKIRLSNLTWMLLRSKSDLADGLTAHLETGGHIVSAAKERLLQVMRCMPSCRAGEGGGASSQDIAELTGLHLTSSRAAISTPLLSELVREYQVEIASETPQKRYRLCP
jgi:hypothetical protein